MRQSWLFASATGNFVRVLNGAAMPGFASADGNSMTALNMAVMAGFASAAGKL